MVHPTAIVSTEAEIDATAEVGPYCCVGPRVVLAPGVRLVSHVVIEQDTVLGKGSFVGPFSVLGGNPQDLKYKGERTSLQVGEEAVIREHVVINRGTRQGGGVTRIGSRGLIMSGCHIGHDVQVEDNVIIASNAAIAGHVTIQYGAAVGGLSAITQYVRIGALSYIGGQTTIRGDIPCFTVALGGQPLVLKGLNRVGLRRKGFSVDVIRRIGKALDLWFDRSITKEDCLMRMRESFGDCPEVLQLVHFIEGTQVGVCR
jgi:UDP-N-acetylglucosamine acyltransferase